jgi:hypothetical protein
MSRAKKHGLPWRAAEMRTLRAVAKARLPAIEAARRTGRSHGAVRFKAMVEGVHFCAVRQPRGLQKRLGARRRRYGMRATLRQVRR